MKRYDKYKNTSYRFLPQIPVHWKVKYARVCFCENKKSNSDNQETLLLQFSYGTIIRKKVQDASKESDTYSKYTVVEPRDIVINGLNLNYDFVSQRVGIVKEKGIITSAYLVIRGRDILIPEYATYLLKSLDDQKIFHGMGSGVRLTLGYNEFARMQFPVPPREEQDQIVRYLDWKVSEINHLINGYQKQITLLKEQRVAVINKAVTKGINSDVEMIYSGHEHIGMIPSTWNVCRIKDFCQLQNGISKGGDYFGSGFPFVNYSDVYKNAVIPNDIEGLIQSTENEQDRYSVQRGDYFFTRTSETLDEVGFSSACVKTIENACFSGFLIRVRPFKDIMDIEYGKYYFRAYIHRLYFTKEMNLVTRASLGQTLLKNLPVLLPCREEQKKIADYLDENVKRIDKVLADIEKQIELLKEYRTRLISDVVAGQIDVRDVIIPDYKSETDDDIAGDDADYDKMESEVSSDE